MEILLASNDSVPFKHSCPTDVTAINVLCYIDDSHTVEEISMMESGIKNIEKYTFFSFEMVKIMRLNDNEIRIIQAELFKYNTRLSELYLHRNNISVLEAGAFSTLYYLKVLYLAENKLTEIVDNVFTYNLQLQFLYLFKNNIEYLHPKNLINLKLLEYLSVSYNNINYLDISENKHLKVLHFANNDLAGINLITRKKFPNIQEIDMIGNSFSCGYAKSMFEHYLSMGIDIVNYRKIPATNERSMNRRAYLRASCVNDKINRKLKANYDLAQTKLRLQDIRNRVAVLIAVKTEKVSLQEGVVNYCLGKPHCNLTEISFEKCYEINQPL